MGVYDFSIVTDRLFFGINTYLQIDPNLIPYPGNLQPSVSETDRSKWYLFQNCDLFQKNK